MIGGIEQSPIEGVSFAPSLTDAGAASSHVTQYYEMLGSRALYHDGWKSVVFHPTPFIAYDGTRREQALRRRRVGAVPRGRGLLRGRRPGREGTRAAREDEGALVGGGGQVPGAAAEQPAGAVRRSSLPPGALRVLPGHRPAARGRRAEPAGPRLHDGGRARRAGRRRRSTGTIVAHGSHSGGYALYLQDRRLHFAYNFVGTDITVVSAGVDLPAGEVEVRGRRHRRRRRPARCRCSTATCRWARAPSRGAPRSPTG